MVGLPFAEHPPTYGVEVVTVGHQGGLPYTVTKGIVSHPRRGPKPQWGMRRTVQTDVGTVPGASGGPLLTRFGEVVGICSRFRRVPDNQGLPTRVWVMVPHLAFFVHLEEIREFLGMDLR